MKMMNVGLLMMMISTQGCATQPNRDMAAVGEAGRVVEFRSDSSGFDTKTYFYIGAEEVIAFDSQFTPELARQSIAHLRTITNKPISKLVLTHPNPDKFNGASVFKNEGAIIVSSKATAAAIPGVHAYKEYYFVEMAKMFKKGTYPQPVNVDETFEGRMTLTLRDGETIQLRELSQPGVSSTQTVAYIECANSLFVGDLIHNQAHAWLEGGIVGGKPVPTLKGWIADLKELAAAYPASATVFGGRGITADLQTSVHNQTQYLETALKIVDGEIKSLGPARAKAFKTAAAGAMYKALAAKFAQAFPEYELAYMIEYGAYGLVESRLATK